MRKTMKFSISAFAVFCIVLMLSAAFVSPVTAKASGQVNVLQRYNHYNIKTAKNLPLPGDWDWLIELIDKIIRLLYPSVLISWFLAWFTEGKSAIWVVIGSGIMILLAIIQGLLSGQFP